VDITAPWADGEEKLRKLCHRLNVDYSKAHNGLQDFIDDDTAQLPQDLMELKSAIETIPVTSADAERGFSSMNIIMSPLQNRLGVERLANLVFVSLTSPPVNKFNALPYVKKVAGTWPSCCI